MTASLYDPNGQRKYLTPSERVAFLGAADEAPRETRTFCHMLAHTGCRISEALALIADRVDLKEGVIVFESLKRGKRGVYRAVSAPPPFLDTLNTVHHLKAAQKRRDQGERVLLWMFARKTAWRHFCAVMKKASISRAHATPIGLRHAFGIKGVTGRMPLNALQKWLRHAMLSTTSIYADATGPEAEQLAKSMRGST